MKICKRCGADKPFSDFNKATRNRDGFHSYCRECHKAYYKDNAERHKARVVARAKPLIEAGILWRYEYMKKSGGCSWPDCCETNPIVLDFDHINQDEKQYNIASMIRAAYPISALEKEAAKCRILCANHHRIRTAEQLGWKSFGLL